MSRTSRRRKQTFSLHPAGSSCRKMTWRRSLLRVSLGAIFAIHCLGAAVGLTTFYYCSRNKSFVDSAGLNRYCKFMGLAFFALYPVALILLTKENFSMKEVTSVARSFVFIGNWCLCTLIYMNQTSYSSASCKAYNRARALLVDIMKNQYHNPYRDDVGLRLSLAAKCVFKTGILASGFTLVNFAKFSYWLKPEHSFFDLILFVMLFLPSLVMILASNRFYVATSFTLYLITTTNVDLRAVADGYRGLIGMSRISPYARNSCRMASDKIDRSSRHLSTLHQLFVGFHDMFGKYIVVILGFCFMNVVFEVGPMRTLSTRIVTVNISPPAALLSLLECLVIDFQWHSAEFFLCGHRRIANRFVFLRNLLHHQRL